MKSFCDFLKKTIIAFIIIILLLNSIIVCFAIEIPSNNNIYSDVALDRWINTDVIKNSAKANFESKDESITLKENSSFNFTVNIIEENKYNILFCYRVLNKVVALESQLNLKFGTQNIFCALNTLWTDYERNIKDRRNDEILPTQTNPDKFSYGYLYDRSDVCKANISVDLSAGVHDFTVSSEVQGYEILDIYFVPIAEIQSYEKYISNNEIKQGKDFVSIEGEDYALKSDSYIRGENEQKKELTPYNTYNKKINILSGESWNLPGQKVLWEFNIENEGWYKVGMFYQQPSNICLPVYRRVEIDGSVPFKEWENCIFKSTGSTNYQLTELNAVTKDSWIFLSEGPHTISMTVSIEPLKEMYDELMSLISEINDFGNLLLKITGGETDTNRTWNMDSYMPQAKETIIDFTSRVNTVYKNFNKLTEEEPVYAQDLLFAYEALNKIAEKENKIPNYTELLCFGDGSVTSYLTGVISNITEQSVSIDKIYIYGNNLPETKKLTFFESIWESIKKFFYSFSPRSIAQDYSSSVKKNSEELTVWVGQPVMSISLMQQVLDETYNKKNNTNIQLTYMASSQKLVMANAVGITPDVVISCGSADVINFAIRGGAAKNLLEYEDFFEFYTKDYSLENLVSTFYNDGVYGVTEARDFNLLFYRKDILEQLGLKVPDTWDDVKAMMPTLLRHSMNFSLPTSSGGASIASMAPFIYQNNGNFYSSDGSKTELDSENTIYAMNEVMDFYRVYGVQQSVASFFNSFRYGQIPIGISNYNTYLQLSMAAPELNGLWDIALAPGTKDENGQILRYQSTNTTACMIFEDTKKSNEAWDFLKWWLSSETQEKYSLRRQTTFGAQYLWNTANNEAFDSLPFTAKQKAIIKEQYSWQREIISHPADYLLSREIGNIWNNVVLSNKSLVDSINTSTILSNREIKRKLQEFGFVDSQGNVIKEYPTRALERLEKLQKESIK